MGTYEILEKSSEGSFRDIVELKTPSPLRSSESSDSNKSLLNGINELLERRLVRDLDDRSVGRSANRDFSEYVDFGGKSGKESGNLSTSIESSSSSSPSSLKQRIRDFPTSGGNLKFSDRLAALDRRIRRERDAYLQLLGWNDRIDEKDEGEANASDEIVMIAADSRNDVHGGSRRSGNASFSAPQTTRLETENCTQRLSIASDNLATARLKKFEESRPPKYLRPIDPTGREIIRSNAPPLCLTDEKIVQLLRRGSASAREETLRKSKSARASGKLAAYGKPTGLIIQNLSSDSEDDGCNAVNEKNGKSGASIVTRLGGKKNRDETNVGEITNGVAHPLPKENVHISNSRKSSARSNDDTDFPDNPGSSKSEKRIEKAERMKNNVGRLRSVVEKTADANFDDNRSTLVPRLDIKSQENSRSESLASQEDGTKRSLDVDQLIRALSNVSIQQQIDRQIAWADRHFPVAGSSSRLSKKADERSSKLQSSNESVASHNERGTKKIVTENRVDKMSGKMSYSKSSDYIDPRDESSKPVKTGDSWRIKSLDTKNNCGSVESLGKNRPEKPRRGTVKGQLSEPVTSRYRGSVQIITEYSSRRDRTPSKARRSEFCSADGDRCRVTEKQTKSSTTEVEKLDHGSDRGSRANFDIYEDPCEDSTRGNRNLSSRMSELSPNLAMTSDRPSSENYESRSNRRNWKNPASRNLFWADNSSELSHGMASGPSDSSCQDIEKDPYDSGSRSCLISPGVSMQALSKLSSSRATTDTSGCSSEDSPDVSKNPEAGKRLVSGSINKENETLTGDENDIPSPSSLMKRLANEEIQELGENIDSPRRGLGKKMEKSESAMDAVRKAFEAPHRAKISSSLSQLEASPNDSRRNSSNLGGRKKSQDRSPFTITCGKSSPPVLRAKRNGQSETTYRSGFNPSFVRLVNGGVDFPTHEVSHVFSAHPDVPGHRKRRPFVPKIRKFVGKLSRWRRWKSIDERSHVEETTRVLYENKACRMGEPSSAGTSESAAPMTTEKPCSNRDGLWVVGFDDESKPNQKESAKTLHALHGVNDKYELVATTHFQEEREQVDVDLGNGCFCAKFCRFLIGGDDYYRYTFPSGRFGGFTQ